MSDTVRPDSPIPGAARRANNRDVTGTRSASCDSVPALEADQGARNGQSIVYEQGQSVGRSTPGGHEPATATGPERRSALEPHDTAIRQGDVRAIGQRPFGLDAAVGQ